MEVAISPPFNVVPSLCSACEVGKQEGAGRQGCFLGMACARRERRVSGERTGRAPSPRGAPASCCPRLAVALRCLGRAPSQHPARPQAQGDGVFPGGSPELFPEVSQQTAASSRCPRWPHAPEVTGSFPFLRFPLRTWAGAQPHPSASSALVPPVATASPSAPGVSMSALLGGMLASL